MQGEQAGQGLEPSVKGARFQERSEALRANRATLDSCVQNLRFCKRSGFNSKVVKSCLTAVDKRKNLVYTKIYTRVYRRVLLSRDDRYNI